MRFLFYKFFILCSACTLVNKMSEGEQYSCTRLPNYHHQFGKSFHLAPPPPPTLPTHPPPPRLPLQKPSYSPEPVFVNPLKEPRNRLPAWRNRFFGIDPVSTLFYSSFLLTLFLPFYEFLPAFLATTLHPALMQKILFSR
jgi:hypothetical protein